MTRLVAVVLGLLLPALALPAAAAEPVPVVDGVDAAGDVTLMRDDGGLTLRQRTSVDLRRVGVTDLGRKVRFAVKTRRVTSSQKFLQRVSVRFEDEGGVRLGNVSFSWQDRRFRVAVHYVAEEIRVACKPVPQRARRDGKEVSLRVPKRCLPPGRVHIRVGTSTTRRPHGPAYSRDTLTLPGVHELR